MRRNRSKLAAALTAASLTASSLAAAPSKSPATRPSPDYAAEARDVMRGLRRDFGIPNSALFSRSRKNKDVDFVWAGGVVFSAILGEARHDPAQRPEAGRFFAALNGYWDTKAPVPGYEPAPTNGNGHDKYYDDNAWLVLNCSEAYAMTGDDRYRRRAEETLKFVLSGWDDQLGGGIWWHEGHKDDGKNTCINAPAAVGCLRVARMEKGEAAKQAVATARKIVDWTVTHLQDPDDALFYDHVKVSTGKVEKGKLTYNTALMIRAWLGLYHAEGNPADLRAAERASKAADWFCDEKTGGYRDAARWSHLMAEADIEMYRTTGDAHALARAKRYAEVEYAKWQKSPPEELIDNAAIARTLWLLADTQSPQATAGWKRLDGPVAMPRPKPATKPAKATTRPAR